MKVSVLILSYNQENTIYQTLESVSSQITNFDFEIIIGDDSSIDRTREICEEFSANNNNIYLLEKTKNVGLIDNYKRLVRNAKGKYIACCAGDDYWIDKRKLQKQFDFLEKENEYGLIHSNFMILNTVNQELTKVHAESLIDLKFEDLLIGNKIGALTVLIRKEILNQGIIDGIINTKFGMEDYPMWLYTAEKYKIGYLDGITAVWRKSPESLSNSEDMVNQNSFKQKIVEIQLFFAKRNNCVPSIADQIEYFFKSILYQSYIYKVDFNCNRALLELIKMRKLSFKYLGFYILGKIRNKNR